MNRLKVVAVAGLAAVALAGCSAGGGDEAGTSAPGAGGPVENAPAAPPAEQGAPAPAQYRVDERSVIYTGDITIRVDNVDAAAAQVGSLADRAGGFVAGDKRASGGSSVAEAHLTLRVPADRFAGTVDEIGKLGTEESRNFSTEDVTQQVVDLDAQIASQKASVDRTRALLARANSVGEIVSIEAELAKRESALATLEARKRRLSDLTSLSTVTVNVLGRDAEVSEEDDDPSFLVGLKTGWSGFLGAMTVLLAILGFLLPFLFVLALPAGAVWWAWRRRRRPALIMRGER